MAIVIRRLEEHDEVENFDCGDDALNSYLKRHAWTNQQKSSIGVSYVALDEDAPRTVLGYFTLAMASVPRDTFPKKYVRGLPPYDLPLILLARLGVDRRFASRGLGHALISEALRISLRVADEVGCRCIITDAYRDRVSWYARYGFMPIEGVAATGPQRMFLDVRTIRAALPRRRYPSDLPEGRLNPPTPHLVRVEQEPRGPGEGLRFLRHRGSLRSQPQPHPRKNQSRPAGLERGRSRLLASRRAAKAVAPVPKAAKAPAAPIAPIAPFKLAAELRTSTIAGILNRGTSLGNFAAAGGAVLPTLLDQVVFHKNRFRQLTIAVLAIAPAQTVDFTANQVESCSAGLWLVSPAQVLKVLEDPQNLAYPALAIAMGYPLPQDDKASAAAMVKVPAAPASVYVYTGKENQTDSQGNTWIPETSDKKNLAIGGGTLSHPAKPVPVITNTKDPALYQSERFGSSFSYTFSHLPPGYYTITLKFAEIVHIDKKSNQGVRIFNVSVNGAQVMTDFDIAADAGADVPDDYSFTDIVPDGKGQIEVQFTGTKGADTNAKISAISIEPQWGNAAAARALSSSGEFPNFYLRLAELAQQGFAGSAFLPMRLRVSENEMDGLTATAVSILGPDETQNGIVSSLIMRSEER